MVNRFEPQPELPHADLGCNTEVYCCDAYVELETLAPLRLLQPGQEAVFPEKWEFYTGLQQDAAMNIDRMRALLKELHLFQE